MTENILFLLTDYREKQAHRRARCGYGGRLKVSPHRRWARASRPVARREGAADRVPISRRLAVSCPVRNHKVRLDRSIEDGWTSTRSSWRTGAILVENPSARSFAVVQDFQLAVSAASLEHAH